MSQPVTNEKKQDPTQWVPRVSPNNGARGFADKRLTRDSITASRRHPNTAPPLLPYGTRPHLVQIIYSYCMIYTSSGQIDP